MSAQNGDEGADVFADLLEPVHERFTIIPNELARCHDLSVDARALLIEWLSHTVTWRLNLQRTADENGITYARARKAVRQLRDAGYVHFVRLHTDAGTFACRYRVANKPVMACGTPGCQDCEARKAAGPGQTYEIARVVPPAETRESPGGTTRAITTVRSSHVQKIEDQPLEDQEEDRAQARGAASLATLDDDGALFAAPGPRPGREPTVNQRAQVLTKGYYEAIKGMCNFLAAQAVVKTTIETGDWADDEIEDALARLTRTNITLTKTTLKRELDNAPNRERGESEPPWL